MTKPPVTMPFHDHRPRRPRPRPRRPVAAGIPHPPRRGACPHPGMPHPWDFPAPRVRDTPPAARAGRGRCCWPSWCVLLRLAAPIGRTVVELVGLFQRLPRVHRPAHLAPARAPRRGAQPDGPQRDCAIALARER
ncbi:MAG: hypothetical protein WKG07_35890 [Hymenobacter sp.]